MRIYTDEIINAICLHIADRKGVKPSDVEAQLSWTEDQGFTAEVWAGGRSQYLIEANLVEAIVQYMHKHYNRRVFPSDITIDAEDDFWADIRE